MLYVPNIIGYARIVLLCVAASHSTTNPLLTYWLFLVNFISDGLDGILARRLNQVSLYGAFLDIAIDIAARGLLWVSCAPHPWGFLMTFLEMLVFVCTHAVREYINIHTRAHAHTWGIHHTHPMQSASAQWKDDMQSGAPWVVAKVMENGFKTPLGILVVYGLMGIPLWLYANKCGDVGLYQ